MDPQIIEVKAPSLKKDQQVASSLKEASRLKYARDRKTVEKKIQNGIEKSDELSKN